jgi:hypothetical protein
MLENFTFSLYKTCGRSHENLKGKETKNYMPEEDYPLIAEIAET